MYQRLGQFVARHWLAIIFAWAALVPTVGWIAPSWDQVTNDGDLAYLPERMTTVRAERLMEEAFPHNRAKSQFVIAFERNGRPDAGRSRHGRARGRLVFRETDEHGLPIVSVVTPKSEVVGRRLISPDGQAALVMVNLGREFMTFANIEGLERIEAKLAEVRESADFPAGLEMGFPARQRLAATCWPRPRRAFATSSWPRFSWWS